MIYAHRGYAAREPEMTRAAYLTAIAWAERSGVPLGLECDVHFSGDGQLICLHDLKVDRTSNSRGPAYQRTLAELRALDFGSWRIRRPTADQRTLITLAELLELTAGARARGVEVSLAIETKHPNPRGTQVEEEVARLLDPYGWTAPGAPVRIITFHLPGLERAAQVLPDLPRTLLIEDDLGPWRAGRLPPGVDTVGPDYALLRAEPDFIERALGQGNQVHVWTVNRPQDLTWCLDHQISGLTTDDPAVASRVVARWESRRRGIA